MDKTVRVVGHDPNGIPRVWAEDDYLQTAYGFALEEAGKYIERRPDTAPLKAWRFTDNYKEPPDNSAAP